MIITDCNCGTKLDCGCTLSFSSYVANPLSVLDVGILEGGTCTFDEYVIDWYRDDELALISGVGNDPEIRAFHPFTGGSAIPVIGGTYVPVLRYAILAGETTKIFPVKKPCQDWCNFTNNLPEVIVVDSLDCGKTNISGLYQYRLSYNTSLDYSLASRSVRWDLPSDGSVINMGLSFRAYTVADKVEVFYNDSSTPIMSWILGYNNNSDSYSAMPYQRKTSYAFKFAFGLPTYQTGDYLIIKVTPSVLETNFNTEWELDIKCLTASSVFNCDFLTDSMRTYDINNTRLDWDSVNCRYVLVLKTNSLIPNFQSSADTNYPFYAYSGMNYFTHTNGYINRAAQECGTYLNFNKSAKYYWWTTTGYNTYVATTGNVNLTKTDNTLVFTCADIADYNRYKAAYDAVMLLNFNTNKSSDPTNVSYYRWFYFQWRSMPLGCGDTTNSIKDFWFYIGSTFTFNETEKTITINVIIPTNGIIDEDCNTVYNSVSGSISNMSSCMSFYGNFSEDTTCGTSYLGWGQGYDGINVSKVTAYNSAAGILMYSPYTSPCSNNMGGFCMHPTIPKYYAWFMFFARVEITATVDGNGDFTEDPQDNFLVKEMRNPVTLCLAQPWSYVLIYEKKNGVQIYP